MRRGWSRSQKDKMECGSHLPARRARRTLTEAQKRRIAARDGWRCVACKNPLPAAFQVDHIVPLCEGGADHADNCQTLCGTCHADKTQEEAIRRAARQRAARKALHPVLECGGCGARVSPFFAHRCASQADVQAGETSA